MTDMALPVTHLRVDQVGALSRPEWLLEMFRRHGRGEVTDEDLREAQDHSIRALVAKQESIGLPVITDGEQRRRHFMESFSGSVSGFAGARPVLDRGPVSSRLRMERDLPLEEYRFAKSLTTRTVKASFIGPDRIAQKFEWESSRAVYPDLDAFTADVVDIERRMVQELVAEGCRYVQVDAPSYTAYLDPVSTLPMQARGEDVERNIGRALAADNAVIEGFPGVTFGVHLCRGKRPGSHRRVGGYDAIAERLFNTLRHDRFLLEFDTDRAGGFEPLRFVPRGKIVVLGLVSITSPRLESKDELKRRIDEAARYLPLEQLALSPACGFGGGIFGAVRAMSDEEQWRKLELVMQVAHEVWN